jgi:hypothetical protein
MKFTTTDIETSLNDRFSSVYPSFSGFVGTKYWEHCMKAIRNKSLLWQIIINNEQKIPPVMTFLQKMPIEENLKHRDNQSIGTFWGYVFKTVFRYREQRIKNILGQVNTVTAATYFYDPIDEVEIV